jgi:hypothetical protein
VSFTLKFDTDNAAFHDPNEVSRILKEVANNAIIRISEGPGGVTIDGTILDINGNAVGEWTYDPPSFDHEVVIAVKVRMTEMDNADPEVSAELALGLVIEALEDTVHGFTFAEVTSFGDAPEVDA